MSVGSVRAIPSPEGLPSTSVSFTTNDPSRQGLYDDATRKAAANVVAFGASGEILVEGGGYRNCWIETQPMGGEMYAKRNMRVALRNQTIFLDTQRQDGRFPGMVTSIERAHVLRDDPYASGARRRFDDLDVIASYGWLQGFCFADPAWRMYFWAGKPLDYLQRLFDALVAYDGYLWRTRDSNGDGVLELWSMWDTGEDNSARLAERNVPTLWPFDEPPGTPGLPVPQDADQHAALWLESAADGPLSTAEDVLAPIASMDLMAYSFDARSTLARIARELGRDDAEIWDAAAEAVAARTREVLWDESRQALFDRDRDGRVLPELVHNNLRAMHHGLLDQEMAEAFVTRHLLDPAEFWTPMPLPSIAADEELFRSVPENDWSGQPQGLTYQRAIRALENYGYPSVVTRLGRKLFEAVERGGMRFTQQFDPYTGMPTSPGFDGYGPTLLAALEYLSRMSGVHLDLPAARIWWSSVEPVDFSYTQEWDSRVWTLERTADECVAWHGGEALFRFSPGIRVVSTLEGAPVSIVGIDPEPRRGWLTMPDGSRVDFEVGADQRIPVDSLVARAHPSGP